MDYTMLPAHSAFFSPLNFWISMCHFISALPVSFAQKTSEGFYFLKESKDNKPPELFASLLILVQELNKLNGATTVMQDNNGSTAMMMKTNSKSTDSCSDLHHCFLTA